MSNRLQKKDEIPKNRRKEKEEKEILVANVEGKARDKFIRKLRKKIISKKSVKEKKGEAER